LVAWTSKTKRGTRDQRHLLDSNRQPVKGPGGRVTFTIDQALDFLKRLAPLAPSS
jgi:hypothetical protein